MSTHSDQISTFYNDGRYDKLIGLSQLKLVEKRDVDRDTLLKQDCLWWVSQQIRQVIKGSFSFGPWVPKRYRRVRIPEKGDLLIYFQQSPYKKERHIALCQGDGLAISKFGYGHVFEHPINCVPDTFGEMTSYYRKVQGREAAEPSQHTMDKWFARYGEIIDFTCRVKLPFTQFFKQAINSHPSYSICWVEWTAKLPKIKTFRLTCVDSTLADPANRRQLRRWIQGKL